MYSLLLFWFVMRGKLYWILSFVLEMLNTEQGQTTAAVSR